MFKTKSFRFLSALLFFLTISFTPLTSYAGDWVLEDQAHVMDEAREICAPGILKQKDNGYLYVQVDNRFVTQILPLIQVDGKIVPPVHVTSKKGIGAHISVMYENERIDNEIWTITELGSEFSFQVIELRTVKIVKEGKAKKLWLLAVSCPELSVLRESYGLKPLLKGHDFHITLGYQIPGSAKELNVEEMELLLEECILDAA
ncbi:hypothetical protein [Criblamydia sequanensis]|uniref:Conserved putative secreted protein n=1 Tax=Candidatus Criblamydia sequanensis CRIB-18 TaxID=1437425 RepID=A0A090D1C2_9BACT|nr:hypothetical protein [Criblamydia sequanensis]CDR35181.1 Conserved putative secreted protein [Criblamydia sequanensis CRIB-18]